MIYKSPRHRIFGLDILRALAIVLVVLGHGKYLLKETALKGFPYFSIIDGVDLFFVLSGFLIGGILIKLLSAEDAFTFSALSNFWKRRWFRTLPNYYLILLINFLLVYFGVVHGDIEAFSFHFITFTQNFTSSFQGFFWESWSLSIEEWFYIFTPLALLIASRFLSTKHNFLLVSLSIILLPLVYRIFIYDSSLSSYAWDLGVRKVVLTRLDSIGYGVLGAWLFIYKKQLWVKFKNPGLVLGIAGLLFVGLFKSPSHTFYKQSLYFSLMGLSILFIFPFFNSIETGKGVFAKLTVHLSKISYSMYLINLGIVAALFDAFIPFREGWVGVGVYVFYWLVVIGVSTLLYRYFELPFLNLRDRVTQK